MSWYNLTGAPVPLFADAGETVSLRALLERAYGASAVAEFKQITIKYADVATYANYSYWDPSNPTVTRVLRNGSDIGSGNTITLTSKQDLDAVTLRAGNMIFGNVYVDIQTSDKAGQDSYQELWLKTVPKQFEQASDYDGVVSASDIVATARALAGAYNGVTNLNDCHFIASTIASASGAALPTQSGDFNPAHNEDAGLWRVVHRGSDNAYENWQALLKPGDIVRLEWPTGGTGHTFTVTSGLNAAGQIQVVDNADNKISEHWADYDGSLSKASSVTIYRLGADGLNLINGSPYGDTLHGTVWNDEIRGYGGLDTLKGGKGDDTYILDSTAQVSLGSGSYFYDTVQEKAGQGTDTVVVSRALSDVQTFGQNLYYTQYTLGAHIENGKVGGTQAFDLYGNGLDNVLTGNDAANLLDGKSGDDTLRGGGGADSLHGQKGNDTLYGEGDSDVLYGGSGDDVLHGGFSSEQASGGEDGNDRLYGGDGNDTLIVSYGNDVLSGGAGHDTLSFAWVGADLTIDLASGKAHFDESGSIPASGPGSWASGWTRTIDVTWSSMENLTGGSGNDTLTGDKNANVIEGRGGDDTIHGLGGSDVLRGGFSREATSLGKDGNDHLFGDAGNDTLIASYGHDVLDGGSGQDTLSFEWVGANLHIDLAAGTTTFFERGTNYYPFQTWRKLVTTDWSDMENVKGGLGNDSLTGDSGGNRIDGGLGADVLTGKGGADSFVFSTKLGDGNVDHITDFAAHDLIRLDDTIFASLMSGDLAESAFKNISTGKVDADDHILYKQATGELFYDADGSGKGAAVQFAVLDNKFTLDHADFLVA